MNIRSLGRLDLAIFIFLTLFVFLSSISIAYSQIVLGVTLVLYLINSVREWHNPFRSSLKWVYFSIVVYVGWLIISSFVNPNLTKSLLEIKDEWLFFILPIGLFVAVDSSRRLILLMALPIGVVGLLLPHGLIQYFTGIALLVSDIPRNAPEFGYRVGGFFSHATYGNYMAVAAATLIPFAIMSRAYLRTIYWALFMFGAFASTVLTILSFGRSPIAALGVAILFMLIVIGRRFWKALIILAGFIVVLGSLIPGVTDRFVNEFDKDFEGVYVQGRVYIWRQSLDLLVENPIFGIGPGNFAEVYEAHLPENTPKEGKVSTAHNDFLHMAVTTGIPGLVIFIVLWGVVTSQLWQNYRKESRLNEQMGGAYPLAAICGSICFAATSMYHSTFGDDEVRQLLMIIWAIGLAGKYKISQEASEIKG